MPRIIPIPYRKLVRVLEMEGFKFVRERGDHMISARVESSGQLLCLATMGCQSSSSRTSSGLLRSAATGTWNSWTSF